MTWSVDILKLAESEVRGPEIYWMSAWDDWLPFSVYMYVLRSEGKTVVINTGPPDDLSHLNKMWVSYIGDERAALKPMLKTSEALAKVGVKPDDVDTVIITPFQQYSVSNVDLFPKATICLNKRGWIDFHAPAHPMSRDARQQAFPDHILTYLTTEAWERVHLMEDEEELLPGLRTFHTGAHHPESTAVAFETKGGTAIMADAIFHYGNIERPHPLGIAENQYECKDAYARIRAEADIVLADHDPLMLERHPGGKL